MTKTTRRTLVFGLLAAVAVFFLVGPLNIFNQNPSPDLPLADDETVASSSAELLRSAQDPKVAFVKLFQNKDLVFVGEFGRIKEEVLFAASLIRPLAESGLRALAVDYVLARDQAEIDRLMNSTTFDQDLARKLIFNRYALWGYEEYMTLLKAAWEANTNRDAGNPRFRLIGLSTKPDNSFITKQEDADNPDIMHKVFANGLPDAFMAQVLEKTLGTGDSGSVPKTLIYLDRNSAFWHWPDIRYANEVKRLNFPESRRMAEIVAAAHPGKVATVLLHSPWISKTSKVSLPTSLYVARVGYPASGLIDRAMANLGQDKLPQYPFAIDLGTSTLGNTVILSTDYLDDPKPDASPSAIDVPQRKAKLSDLGDLYVVLGPIASLSPATPIANFINDSNLKDTLSNFPDKNTQSLTSKDINDAVTRLSNDMTTGLARFVVPKK